MRLEERLEKALSKSTATTMGIPVFLLTLSLIQSLVRPEMCEQDVCQTHQCLDVADQMLEAMDTTTKPCDDFYQFACGGWMSRQFLNKNQQKVTTFSKDLLLGMTTKLFAEDHKPIDHPALTKAKTFYSSCIAYANVLNHNETVLDVVASRLKLWPMNNKTWDQDDFDLMEALIKATILGANPLYRIQTSPNNVTDPRIWQRPNKLYFTNPDLAMPLHHYKYLSSSVSYKNIYANKIVSEAEKFGVVTKEALRDATDIVDVEIKIAEMYNDVTHEGDVPKQPQRELPFAFTLLDALIDLLALLGELDRDIITNHTLYDAVIVSNNEYMHRMFDYFIKLPKRTQANYIFWRALDSIQNVLVEDSRKFTNIIMGDNNIFAKLVTQFEDVAPLHYWTHPINLIRVIYKANAMELVIAFLEEAMNDTALESRYSNIQPNSSFINNVLQARKDAIAMDISNIRESKVLKPTSLDLQYAAQYYRNLNKIYITPAVFQPPFFHYNVPKSIIYAGYGSIIAHEIMRGFDKKGYKYDGEERHGYWNDNFKIVHNQAITHCFTNWYNDLVNKYSLRRVNSTSFIDRTIADAHALILAYKAFNASHEQTEQLLPGVNLTSEQIFFVKYAQMRCTVESKQSLDAAMDDDSYVPDKFRINGVLQNSYDFSRAFICDIGAAMHPKWKCIRE